MSIREELKGRNRFQTKPKEIESHSQAKLNTTVEGRGARVFPVFGRVQAILAAKPRVAGKNKNICVFMLVQSTFRN